MNHLRLLTLLLLLCMSVQAESFTTTITLPVPEIQETTDGYCRILASDMIPSVQVGKPVLPMKAVRIIIPEGMAIDSICVTPLQKESLLLDMPIEFGQPTISFGEETPHVAPDTAIYHSNIPFPGVTNSISTIQEKAGVAIAYVNIYPYQYRALSSSLKITKKLQLTVLFKSATTRSNQVARIDRIHHANILNPEALSSYSCGPRDQRESYDWLCITSKSMLDAVAPFTIHDLISLRQQQGLKTKLITVEEILENSEGVDAPQKIRNYLRDEWNSAGFKYCFLAGDTNIVPARQLYAEQMTEHQAKWKEYWMSRYALYSDIYYQCLDGDYNSNGNELWGEFDDNGGWKQIDLSAEFAIGRIAAENGLELSNWLAKVVAYETQPVGDSYLKTVLLAGEYLGMGQEKEYAKTSLLELKNGAETHSLSTTGFSADPSVTIDELYQEDLVWHETEMADKINSNSASVISHLGHGLEEKMMYLHRGNTHLLQNNKPLFLYSQACMVGKFDGISMAEHFTAELPTGCFGGVFNSGFGKTRPNNTYGPSAVLNRWFWDGYFKNENPIERIGDLNQYSHEQSLSKIGEMDFIYVIYSSNLHGDPYTRLRLRNPIEENPSLWILSPSENATVEQEQRSIIRWGTTSSEPITITLFKGGTNIAEIATVSDNNSFTWQVATDLPEGDDYSLQLTTGTLSAHSKTFTIAKAGEIKLLTPSSDTSLSKNSEVNISWESSFSGAVSLVLMQDSTVVQVLSDNAPDNGSYLWHIDSTLATASNWRVALTPEAAPHKKVISEPFSLFSPAITTYPYLQDFENFSTGPSKLGGTALIDYWEQSTIDEADWTVLAGPTPSRKHPQAGTTGAEIDHTKGDSTGKYLYVEASGENNNKRFDLLSPPFDLKGCGKPQLSFWYHMYADSGRMGDLNVDLLLGQRDRTLLTISGNQGDSWQKAEIDLSSWEGKTIQLRFRGNSGENWESDICIDDIALTATGDVHISQKKSTYRTTDIVAVPHISTGEPISFFISTEKGCQLSGGIFDKLGNTLDSYEGIAEEETIELQWDCTNESGAPVGAGTYLFILSTTSPNGTSKTVHKTVGVQR